jgi:DNA primase catalytic subunit
VSDDSDFDLQAAWLRRFTTDAESNLKALALRLKEAMPELVTVHNAKSLFSSSQKVTGVTIELGDNHYNLEISGGRLKATVAMVVRGITLNTKSIEPAEWFARLSAETKKITEHAQALSRSLSSFMAG